MTITELSIEEAQKISKGIEIVSLRMRGKWTNDQFINKDYETNKIFMDAPNWGEEQK